MTKIVFNRKRGETPQLSDAERERLVAMTDAEIEANALSDPDNPPVDAARLHRMALGREVRLIREKAGLSQPAFAARYRIGLARLRDYEQARSEPDFPMMAYLRLIADHPSVAEEVVADLLREGVA